jgi:hypothetical protein
MATIEKTLKITASISKTQEAVVIRYPGGRCVASYTLSAVELSPADSVLIGGIGLASVGSLRLASKRKYRQAHVLNSKDNDALASKHMACHCVRSIGAE